MLALTGAGDLEEGCRALVQRGAGCVVATRGAEGALIVDASSAEGVPAFPIDAVDTTGCGDAFSAGFLRGLSLGRDRRDAARLGCAAAALVAQGLGSDHGDFDLGAADELASRAASSSRRNPAPAQLHEQPGELRVELPAGLVADLLEGVLD